MITTREQALAYIESLADQFRLSHWRFEIIDPDAESLDSETIEAYVEFHDDWNLARIALLPLFYRLAPEGQRHVIVHELLHVHTAGMFLWCKALRERKVIRKSEFNQFVHEWEKSVESMSQAIAPTFPLPLLIPADKIVKGSGRRQPANGFSIEG